MLDPTGAAEEAVTRFLRSAPTLTTPEDVLATLRRTVAGEVELRRASTVDPDPDLPELKRTSELWSDKPVADA